MNTQQEAVGAHTPGPWRVTWDNECPWTCGDSAVAIEQGTELGHTEILIPVTTGDETPAYIPWEPLMHDCERGKELRANAQLIAKAPELYAALGALLERLRTLYVSDAWPEIDAARSVLAAIDGTEI